MPQHTWRAKFGDAFRGLYYGPSGQSSFAVHFCIAAVVVAAGIALRVTTIEWCALSLCIAVVLTAEMFNSALESLAKGITSEHNEHIGRALDMASGAVLIVAIGSVVVGLLIFLPHLMRLL